MISYSLDRLSSYTLGLISNVKILENAGNEDSKYVRETKAEINDLKFCVDCLTYEFCLPNLNNAGYRFLKHQREVMEKTESEKEFFKDYIADITNAINILENARIKN